MKKTKYTDEQIAFALRQAETGTRVAEVCRKMGISEVAELKVMKLHKAAELIEDNIQETLTFYRYPDTHQQSHRFNNSNLSIN